jgi:hypothetical protein
MVIRPILAEIDGQELPHYFDCAGKSGTHELLCYLSADHAELQLKEASEVEEEEGTFYIGEIDLPSGEIDQVWESDIAWPFEQSSSSAPSEESEDSDDVDPPGSDPSDEESEKSTAIVRAPWTKGGFTALYAMEAPDVRFEDILRSGLKHPVTRLKIDPRFVAVCEPGSIDVVAVIPERPMSIGAKVAGGFVVITRPARSKPCQVTVSVSGIRKGFAGRRWPDLDRAIFEANEKFLKSARPKKKP